MIYINAILHGIWCGLAFLGAMTIVYYLTSFSLWLSNLELRLQNITRDIEYLNKRDN
jgi:hypothetical protein